MTGNAIRGTYSLVVKGCWEPTATGVTCRTLTTVMFRWAVIEVAKNAICCLGSGVIENNICPHGGCMTGLAIPSVVIYGELIAMALQAILRCTLVVPVDMAGLAFDFSMPADQRKKIMITCGTVLRKRDCQWVDLIILISFGGDFIPYIVFINDLQLRYGCQYIGIDITIRD